MSDAFFGFHVPVDHPLSLALALVLSVVVGALIGFEREVHGHPAGLRTHILVALGATLVTLVSVSMAGREGTRGDPARLAAQVVTGIGFLGAGAIIRDGGSIRGLTTAASIWMTAMLGIAVGASPSTGALAVIATGIAMVVLWWLHRVEQWMARRGVLLESIEIHVRQDASATSEVLTCVAANGTAIRAVEVDPSRDGSRCRIVVRGTIPGGPERAKLMAELAALDGVRSASIE